MAGKRMTLFGQWIMKEAESRNLTLRELARKIGMSHSPLSRYTKVVGPGDHIVVPGLLELRKLSKFTQINLGTLGDIVAVDIEIQSKPTTEETPPPTLDTIDPDTGLSFNARLFAERYDKLTEPEKALINRAVFGGQPLGGNN